MSDEYPWVFAWGLGVVVHGPQVLSSGPGVGIGLRCAFGYPEGLLLSLDLKAVGQAAQDLYDAYPRPGGDGWRGPGQEQRPRQPYSSVRLAVLEAGKQPPPDVPGLRGMDVRSGSLGADPPATAWFGYDVDWWIPGHGRAETLSVQVGWPQIGAPLTTTVLHLRNMNGPAGKVVALR